MAWLTWCDEHGAPAARGSEGGVVVADEEHEPWGARITLEREAGRIKAAITCGLYGWMLHTRYFADLDAAQREYEAMKVALAELVSLVPLEADPDLRAKSSVLMRAISAFAERFP